MRHPKRAQWETKLRSLLNDIDQELESEYGGRFSLHPSRSRQHAGVDPKYAGLFQLGASFSAGFGSRLGRGYILQLQIVTLQSVPDEFRNLIEQQIEEKLRKRLPLAFPGRVLRVEREGRVLKIIGDLRLGTV